MSSKKGKKESEVAEGFDDLSCLPPFYFWKNPSGGFRTASGGFMRFGVGRPGGSDRIGYESVLITPEMVGMTLAVFAVVELKRQYGGRLTPDQLAFLTQVANAGGIAIVTNDPVEAFDELRRAMRERIEAHNRVE